MSEPLTGVTTRVELLYRGAPAISNDEIGGFNDSTDIETRTFNPLGAAATKRNQIVRGYTGTITFEVRSSLGAQFTASYLADIKAGIKPDVSIVETSTHADTGLQTTRQWLVVTILGFERSFSGTANVSGTFNWAAEEMVSS
jgi:hypothetical protein